MKIVVRRVATLRKLQIFCVAIVSVVCIGWVGIGVEECFGVRVGVGVGVGMGVGVEVGVEIGVEVGVEAGVGVEVGVEVGGGVVVVAFWCVVVVLL
jgi:hypothetical protein